MLSVSCNNLFNVLVAFERSNLIPMLFKSCRMVCIQVVFGLPRGLFTFLRYSSRAFLVGVSGCSRIRCPSHASLLALSISLKMACISFWRRVLCWSSSWPFPFPEIFFKGSSCWGFRMQSHQMSWPF